MTRQIVSIAAAPGWAGRFRADPSATEVRMVTLASWAVVQDAHGSTEIVGIVQRAPTPDAPTGWLGFADEVDGFQGYAFTGVAPSAPAPL